MTRPPITLPDFEAAAREVLDHGAFGYISGGALDGWTLAENVAAWRRLAIVPRVLVDDEPVDTAVTVLGARLPHPIVAAPMAYQRIAHAAGEVAMAQAAAATSTTLCVSTLSTVAPAQLGREVPGGRRWYQVYVFTDRGVTHELITAALASGCEALVLTVDVPAFGIRESDLRSGYRVAADVPAVAAAGLTGAFQPGSTAELLDTALSWGDVADMASRYGVPVLVKGILAADDARRALDEGAAGVVVSNHGGRQLDGSVATATVLAEIVDAVAGRGDVLVDGGIRRGTDVLRALALGACAVMVGRPLYWGLAVDGAAGAQSVLELLVAELRNALIISGARSTKRLGPHFLRAIPG